MDVEWADQQKISEFSKLNTRLSAYLESDKTLERAKESYDDLEMEIELVDEDEELLYKIGDAFVYMKQSEIVERIQIERGSLEQKLEEEAAARAEIESRMDKIKTELYAKFGKENINLERE